MKKTTHSTSGVELIRELAGNGQYIFTIEEALQIAPKVNISTQYLTEALHHLAKAGWITRIKKGIYVISSLTTGAAIHEFAIAMALIKPAAISHWSAMNYHGFSEQIPNTVFVTTTAQNFPRNNKATSKKGEFVVMGQVYKFIHSIPKHFFGMETIWLNESKVCITDKERTLLDGLMKPLYCGSFADVLHAFEIAAGKINISQIIQYASKLNVSTAKRLGWILDEFNLASQDELNILQSIPVKGYRLLDPTSKQYGKCNTKWMLQINL